MVFWSPIDLLTVAVPSPSSVDLLANLSIAVVVFVAVYSLSLSSASLTAFLFIALTVLSDGSSEMSSSSDRLLWENLQRFIR